MLRVMLEAVYVDVDLGKVVGISPKPSFLALFNLKEPLTTTGAVLVTGDPDGIRTHDLRRDRPIC